MRAVAGILSALVLVAGAWHPLPAQTTALVVFGHGGRYSPLSNLNDEGDDVSAAFSYGGGVALQLTPSVALRGSVTMHRSRYRDRGGSLALGDSGLTQLSFGGDLQIGFPGTSALVPYVFLGGGLVTTDPDDSAHDTKSSLAGRFGLGLNRVSGLGAWFLEMGGLVYPFDAYGQSRVQFDLEARIGFAVAVPM